MERLSGGNLQFEEHQGSQIGHRDPERHCFASGYEKRSIITQVETETHTANESKGPLNSCK
ncbi:hypothetical protein J6590_083958 [Homalodisca vitripennis]|nr:hypothetical protein J6590_083958 [Homalodisca vitripennis]